MKVEFKYLIKDQDRHGNVRVYVRIRGKGKIRLRAEPGTADFSAAYQAAIEKLNGEKPKAGSDVGTLRWLVNQFEASPAFLKVTFREQRNRHLLVKAALDEPHQPGSKLKIGDCSLKFFDGKLVRILRDRKAKTPSAANHRLSNLRLIFNWALEERPEHVKSNPFLGVTPIKHKSEGWHTWSEEEVAKYEERHLLGTQARLALG